MSAVDAVAALVLVPLAVWLLGACIVPASGPAERIAAGVLAALGLAWLTMLQAPLGVGLLGHRVALDVAFAAGLAGLLAWRRPDLRPARIHLGAVAALVVPAAVVLAPGVVHPPNLIRSSDSLWHEGWTHQLVGGAPDPGGPYAGIPNAYPWLFHALAAWSTQLLPGGVLTGFLAMQVLALLAAGAGMWLVSRALGLREDAAAWAVLLGVGAGGVGWLWQRSPAAVTFLKDGLGAYHGDFVLPNAMSTGMGNLPPILPREVALALVPLVVWAAVRSASGRSLGWALIAGYALGLAFLLGPDDGGVALAVVLALALAWRTIRPLAALVSAAAVVPVWGIPLALHYHELGGFRSITTHEPVDPTAGQAAVALGLLPLLAIPGAVILARRPDADRRSLAAWAGVVVAVNAVAIAIGSGHVLLGTPALLRWLRYLPFLALVLAVPAGEAAAALVSAVAGRRALAVAAASAVLVAGVLGSTVLAAAAIWHRPSDPGLACAGALDLGPHDVVAVVARPIWVKTDVGFWLFTDTGARSLYLGNGKARVRYRRYPAGVAHPRSRQAELDAMRHGAAPPAGVTWVISNLPRADLAPGLARVSACEWRRTVPLILYRVGGGG